MNELTLEDILNWIIAHREDEKAMDDINQLSWSYTNRYKEKRRAMMNRYNNRTER